MMIASISRKASQHFTSWVAIATVCVCFYSLPLNGAENFLPSQVVTKAQMKNAIVTVQVQPAISVPKNMQVLSAKDEELYRVAFAAQEKMDWDTADIALEMIQDKRLFGHVFADRYERCKATSEELRLWLASYNSLPEAQDIYAQARHMPSAKGNHFTMPKLGDGWARTISYGNSSGFRIEERSNDGAHGSLQSESPLGLWNYGLMAWRRGDVDGAKQAFTKLAAHPGLQSWDRSAAEFWAYRATKRTGDNEGANYWLRQAATQPHSFYGFLAAHLLGRDVAWTWSMPQWDENALTTISSYPAGWRALALIQIGQPSLAQLELRHLNTQRQHDVESAMLALAEKAHMPFLSMQLSGLVLKEDGKPYDAAMYPLPPWQPAQGYTVDRALIFALMRLESQFNPEAVSASGACGLMQLLPTTAHLVSNDNTRRGRVCSDHLLEPSYNVDLGQKYVSRLAEEPKIGNNLLYLIASYNWGPGNLMRMTDNNETKDPLLFIESIPVRETHDYVQQVLIHYWTYRARLGQSETTLTELAHGQWPHFVLRDSVPKITREAETQSFKVASSQK